MKPLDDNALAKNDIVSRPEVTAGSGAAPEQKTEAPAPVSDEQAERKGRIVARALSRVYNKATGEVMGADEQGELGEVTGLLFRALPEGVAGRTIGASIVALCLALPFVPLLTKLFKPKQEKTNEA